jgi:hypothetical protein
MTLIIKVYRPNENFPVGGRVSQYLDQIKLSEEIEIKFPYGKICYYGAGLFFLKYGKYYF